MTALNTIPAEENDTLLNKPKASAWRRTFDTGH